MKNIKSKTEFSKDTKEEDKIFILEDKDYLLIMALQDLKKSIDKLSMRLLR